MFQEPTVLTDNFRERGLKIYEINVEILSISPAKLGDLLLAVNISELLDSHGVEDVGDPGGEQLESDVVDWVVKTPTVAKLAAAPARGIT